jgi:hypothetical protein
MSRLPSPINQEPAMTLAFAARQRRVFAFVAVVIGSVVASGVVCAAPDAAFDNAFQQFIRASGGDKSATEPAAEAFDALLKAEPTNPVLLAYAGASTAMRAGTTVMPWKKMGYAEDGLAMIDKALAMLTPAHDAPVQRGTPGSLEVRFVAANSFLAVPGFMNRAARGTKLLGEVLASPLFDTSPLPFRGTVWMRAARLATQEQRGADAQRYLNEVISHNAPQAEQARALLKGAA